MVVSVIDGTKAGQEQVTTVCSDAILRELLAELLEHGKQVRFRARGGSMYPSIQDGEFITVTPVTLQEIQVGDVLVYQHIDTKKVIVHRLIKIQKDSAHSWPFLLFAGDDSVCCDAPAYAPDYLLGRVVAVEGNGRRVSLESKLNRMRGWFKVQCMLFCPRTLRTVMRRARRGPARIAYFLASRGRA